MDESNNVFPIAEIETILKERQLMVDALKAILGEIEVDVDVENMNAMKLKAELEERRLELFDENIRRTKVHKRFVYVRSTGDVANMIKFKQEVFKDDRRCFVNAHKRLLLSDVKSIDDVTMVMKFKREIFKRGLQLIATTIPNLYEKWDMKTKLSKAIIEFDEFFPEAKRRNKDNEVNPGHWSPSV